MQQRRSARQRAHDAVLHRMLGSVRLMTTFPEGLGNEDAMSAYWHNSRVAGSEPRTSSERIQGLIHIATAPRRTELTTTNHCSQSDFDVTKGLMYPRVFRRRFDTIENL